MTVAFILAGALLGPVMLYLAARSPEPWGFARAGAEARESGGYRDSGTPPFVPTAAPAIVHAAAFVSFLLGQVLIPGVFAALAGLALLLIRGPHPLLLLLVASAPTGLTAAGVVLGAGFGLLRRDLDAAARARRAARWAIGHHTAFLFAVLAIARLGAARVPCAALTAFALAGIAGGALLLGAARAVAAHDTAADPARAPEVP